MMNDYDEAAIALMREERSRQDEKWGGADHDDTHHYFAWVGFIKEECDELLAAMHGGMRHAHVRAQAMAEAAQVGALCVAFLASMYRTGSAPSLADVDASEMDASRVRVDAAQRELRDAESELAARTAALCKDRGE